MVSAVGHDVVTGCASIRAGLSRPGQIEHFEILDDEEAEAIPITGHPLHGYADGFEFTGFWLRVALGCIENLISYARLPDRSDHGFWSRTGLMLVTPVIDQDRYQLLEPIAPEQLRRDYGERLLRNLELPLPSSNLQVVDQESGGVPAAVKEAGDRIANESVDRVIVVAVDSHLDAFTLEWLSEHRRLKTHDQPAGMEPGEAGACFLLESSSAAERRSANIQAVVKGVAVTREYHSYFKGQPSAGTAAVEAVKMVLSGASPFVGDIITDHNGETWRAQEWGNALARLHGCLGAGSHHILPADSLGDTGAAFGAIGVCMAVRSLVRGYATQGQALVISMSEYGARGAVWLAQPGSQ
jgi:3-oxoacyl-[acyl-carrier-protein] synthase-1